MSTTLELALRDEESFGAKLPALLENPSDLILRRKKGEPDPVVFADMSPMNSHIAEMLWNTQKKYKHYKETGEIPYPHRLRRYIKWAVENDVNIAFPRYSEFIEAMRKEGVEDNTMIQWMSGIRVAYKRFKPYFYQLALLQAEQDHPDDTAAQHLDFEKRKNQWRFANDQEIDLRKTIDKRAPIGWWLTRDELNTLIHEFDQNATDLNSWRNRAAIALAACTGVRSQELRGVRVKDLRVENDFGQIALYVNDPKKTQRGIIKRVVVYGHLIWCLKWVDEWLRMARIYEANEVIFPHVRGRVVFRNKRLKAKSWLNRVLAEHPIMIQGQEVIVMPHSLRRTYARVQNIGIENPETGEKDHMPIRQLMEQMGHGSRRITEGYIGSNYEGVNVVGAFGPNMEQELEQLKKASPYGPAHMPKSKGRHLRMIRVAIQSSPSNWVFRHELIEQESLNRREQQALSHAAKKLRGDGEISIWDWKAPGKRGRVIYAKPGVNSGFPKAYDEEKEIAVFPRERQ